MFAASDSDDEVGRRISHSPFSGLDAVSRPFTTLGQATRAHASRVLAPALAIPALLPMAMNSPPSHFASRKPSPWCRDTPATMATCCLPSSHPSLRTEVLAPGGDPDVLALVLAVPEVSLVLAPGVRVAPGTRVVSAPGALPSPLPPSFLFPSFSPPPPRCCRRPLRGREDFFGVGSINHGVGSACGVLLIYQ